MKYKIWNRTDPLISEEKVWMDPGEFIREKAPYLIIPTNKLIIADEPLNLRVMMEFEATKNVYKGMGAAITDDMSDQEVLDAITEFETNPPVSDEPSAEERIAAALEFQNVLSL